MKYLFLFFLVPAFAEAKFQKPELIARMMQTSAWNMPDNTWCFSSAPTMSQGKIYLSCYDDQGQFMAQWSGAGMKVLARAEGDRLFSQATTSFSKVSWTEFNDFSPVRSFELASELKVSEIKNLGPVLEASDSFHPLSADSFFFRVKGETPALWAWKNDLVTPFYDPKAAYIFTPVSGPQGEVLFKARERDLSEKAPDKIFYYDGVWKTIVEDRDSDPKSPWKSFRHHMAVDQGRVLFIGEDSQGEALVLWHNGKTEVLARKSVDLMEFDYFPPQMRGGTIMVRGVDLQGKKALFVKDEGAFRKLVSQGDVILSDLGMAQIQYQNQDSIFFNTPDIDENGSVVFQATLVSDDHPMTLLGIGLIKINKE